VQAFEEAITPRTRLLVVDHVTSMTALVFPVRELIALARSRGILVLVDGAHAPGMLPLDLPALGATWYVGNCHKWLCAPKGSALLWANPDNHLARQVHPPVISHAFGQPFPSEFDWVGTRDLSSWLAIPAALGFRASLGDSAVREWNHRLAMHARAAVISSTGSAPAGPESMTGSMVALQVTGVTGATEALGARLRTSIWQGERIEVACPVLNGQLYIRVSGQVYNDESEAERLSTILPRYLAPLQ
jgi:isopenicillin-N epimerase